MPKNKFVNFVWLRLPEPCRRFVNSFTYNKDKFLLKFNQQVFKDIYNTNLWSSEESKSGEGSTMDATVNIRKQLPLLIEKYSITSMLDAPCGDFNWMKEVKLSCDYIGGDIVEEAVLRNQKQFANTNRTFQKIDITQDNLPKVELIFCKDCLQHLSNEKVKQALKNFKNSGAKYLLVTSYPGTWRNYDIHDGDYRPLNLLIKPFNLSNYIEKIEEKSTLKTVEYDKTMYLFEIKSLPDFN